MLALVASSVWGGDIYIPDPALKDAIQEALGETPTEDNIVFLQYLSAESVGISNLEGIQYATNLETLVLIGNEIYEIGQLAELTNLRNLELNDNHITIVEPLQDLTQLREIYLGGNNVEDISPLTGLVNLENLWLGGNKLTTLPSEPYLSDSLLILDLGGNLLTDEGIEPLSALTNLTGLNLSGNFLSDITPLQDLHQLEGLSLSDNYIFDVNPLSTLTNLRYLYLDRNPISSIAPLATLVNLVHFYLENTQEQDGVPLSDISALANMTELEELQLCYNEIGNISALTNLKKLRWVNLFYNMYISDISPLAGHKNLEFLSLSVNQLNQEAYCVYIPLIWQNNPALTLETFDYDAPPENLVCNTAPEAWITGPESGAIAAANTTIELTAVINDPDEDDIHDYMWALSDGQLLEGLSTDRAISEMISFSEAGIYDIELTVTDAFGESDTATTVGDLPAFIVVYDPSAGFVTGGGWIYSPAGSLLDSSVAGKATFGFVAKYKKGATTPEGNTEFHFQAGDFRFKSSSYDWLVVAGSKAMFKGEGYIDGMGGGFNFMLTAVDDNEDKFRIKIWNPLSNDVIYDNKRGESDEAEPTTIGGGSIVIHKK